MLKKLTKIADRLDSLGFHTEADQIDLLIVKIAIKKYTAETIVSQIEDSKETLGELSKLIQGIPSQNLNYKGMVEDAKKSEIDFSEILTEEYIETMRETLRKIYLASNVFLRIGSNIETSFQFATDAKSKSFYKKSLELIKSINKLFEEIAEDLIPTAYKGVIPLPESISIKWRGALQGMIGACNNFLAEFAEIKRIEELSKEERGIPWPPKPMPEIELPAETTEEITQVSERDPEATNPSGMKRGKRVNRLAEWLRKLYS